MANFVLSATQPGKDSGRKHHKPTKSRREEVAAVCLNCTEEKCKRAGGCQRYKEAMKGGKGG